MFEGLREDIGRIMQEMGHEPETSLEKEAVCSDDDVFLLTHENIKALKLLLCQVAESLPMRPCGLGMALWHCAVTMVLDMSPEPCRVCLFSILLNTWLHRPEGCRKAERFRALKRPVFRT